MRFLHLLLLLPALTVAQEISPPTATAIEPAPKPAAPPKPVIDPYPAVEQVEAAMKRAAAFTRANLSFAGGYATKWSRDLKEVRTSDANAPSVISIEAPGTPVIGHVFLRAWQVTGDPLYLQGAREAAQALLWTQLATGGWSTLHNYELTSARKQHYRRDLDAGDTERGGRKAHTTLDDHKTQYALLFLLELAQLPEFKNDATLHAAVKFSLDSLLAAQLPNGGWPQGFDGPADPDQPVKKPVLPGAEEWPRVWPGVNYTSYVTLNDNNLVSVCELLLRAHELTGEERFLASVKKLGDFLLLAQCPEPQPGWAQQYDAEMRVAWARKFEPPSICSLETLGALQTLHDIWLVTGDDRYRAPFDSALAWLERSRLPDGRYARFYELHTNTPLYFVKDTYELTYDDSNMPTHYGFKLDEDFQEKIDKFKKLIATPREEVLVKRTPPATPREWLSKAKGAASKTAAALREQNREGVWTRNNVFEADLIVRHMRAMTTYVEAAKNAGEVFEAFREKENPKPGGS